MKKILFLIVVLIAGLALGGGAGAAAILLLGPANAKAEAEAAKEAEAPFLVPAGNVLAPLVAADGHLAGYVRVELQVEVPKEKGEFVTTRIPLLQHAINMRTYRTPLAAGPDGMLPNLEAFRKIVMDVAPEAFGPGVVRRVAITDATPA